MIYDPHDQPPPSAEAERPAGETLRPHRCSGCGHRWSEHSGAELCGDCWRTAQSVLHVASTGDEASREAAKRMSVRGPSLTTHRVRPHGSTVTLVELNAAYAQLAEAEGEASHLRRLLAEARAELDAMNRSYPGFARVEKALALLDLVALSSTGAVAASAPSPQPSADTSEISVCGHVGSGASPEAPPSTPEDWEWALDRVTKMCGAALADAHVYGKKLLRGFGYPNETFSRAQDYRALAIVLDRIRSSQPSAEAERPAGETDAPTRHWAVMVYRNGEDILTIESSHLSGKPDFSETDEACIADCARHLLSFVGAPEPTGEASHLRRLLAEAEDMLRRAATWPADDIQGLRFHALAVAQQLTGEAAPSAPSPAGAPEKES